MVARKIPDWELTLIRKSPRMAFVAPVEVLCRGESFTARSRNLSVGGMGIESDRGLLPQAQLHVYFELPTGEPIIAAARVIHCRPGRSLGVEFTNMPRIMWHALARATEIKQNYERRSIRIPERLFVRLYWQQDSVVVEKTAQTVLLSRHGCLLRSPAAPPPNTQLVIFCPDRRIGAPARVVFRQLDNDDGLFTVGLEFVRDINFWGIDFSPQAWKQCRGTRTPATLAETAVEP
jgi:hypothetical protein